MLKTLILKLHIFTFLVLQSITNFILYLCTSSKIFGCEITATDLQDVPHFEGNSCLCTRDEVIFQRVVVKLRPNIDLLGERLLGTKLRMSLASV